MLCFVKGNWYSRNLEVLKDKLIQTVLHQYVINFALKLYGNYTFSEKIDTYVCVCLHVIEIWIYRVDVKQY